VNRRGTPARTGDDVAPLGRTITLARPASWRLLLATLSGAGAIAADIGLIATAAWLISRASEHPNESHLAVAIVAVQFFGLTRGLLRYGERLVGHDAAFRLLGNLRVKVYQRLEALAPAGLPAFQRGDLLARIVADVDSLQDLVIRVIPSFGMAALVGCLTVAIMWWMLPAAGVILAVALVAAALGVPWLTGFLAARREAKFAAVRGALSAAMLDLTEGAAELIAFGGSDVQMRLVQERDGELTSITAASAGTGGIGLALTTLSAGLASWGCLVAGIPAVGSGRLGSTELAVITLIPLAAFELVVGLPVATQVFHRVRQSAGRVFEMVDAPDPAPDPDAPERLPVGPYDLEAHSLWATYPGAAQPALCGVDLSLPQGRRVAVVGPSGAGKSTLAAVLLRFLPAESGKVSLGGVSFDDLTGDAVRTVVGLVGQDAYLFDDTIAGNLRIGRRHATDDELLGVLDRVGLAGWVEGLPRGLATPVGRHGGRVSGGQRQRIALARALVADFPILVLDEPAEHLEPDAADALTAHLLDATAGRSLVLITHRLAGLESVDEVVVMEAGRVVERGSHDTLLDRGGMYARLWWEEMSISRPGSGDAVHPSKERMPEVPKTASTPRRGRLDRSARR
jgi:thiol reductant ABC exporter CydC subunit